jgi:hypothetical protein
MSNKKRIQQTEEAIRHNQNAWLLSSSKADAAIYMKLVREFEKQKKTLCNDRRETCSK